MADHLWRCPDGRVAVTKLPHHPVPVVAYLEKNPDGTWKISGENTARHFQTEDEARDTLLKERNVIPWQKALAYKAEVPPYVIIVRPFTPAGNEGWTYAILESGQRIWGSETPQELEEAKMVACQWIARSADGPAMDAQRIYAQVQPTWTLIEIPTS